MFEPPAQLFEDRPRARRVGRFGAHEPDAAFLGVPDRSSRRPDIRRKRAPVARTARASAVSVAGKHGAHVDEQLSGDVAVKKTGTAVIDRIDRRRVGEDGDDGFAFLRQLRRALPRHFAPATALAFSGVRFQTVTSWPTSISRAAMAAPILPIPAIPVHPHSRPFARRLNLRLSNHDRVKTSNPARAVTSDFPLARANDKPLVRIATECDSLGSLGKIGVGYDGSSKER